MSPKKHEKLTHNFYFREQAEFYGSSQWMAKSQVKTAYRVLELLEDERIGGEFQADLSNCIILDLGCGSGYSSIIFEEICGITIGLDLSFDMLQQDLLMHQQNGDDISQSPLIPILINASINKLPLRNSCIDHIISISAFNFIFDDIIEESLKRNEIKTIIRELDEISLSKARIVIEFYPEKKDLEIYLNSFSLLFDGGLVIDNAGLRKEQKFLILQKKK